MEDVILPLLQDNLVILRAARMDARGRSSAWVKALEKVGCFVYVWPMKHAQLPRWISQRLRAAGLIADEAAVQLLAERTEGNLLAAAQDIAHRAREQEAEAMRRER